MTLYHYLAMIPFVVVVLFGTIEAYKYDKFAGWFMAFIFTFALFLYGLSGVAR
jgi:hypothetical protein